MLRQWDKLDKKAEEQYTRGIKNVCSSKEHHQMGQATRTTKLLLDLGKRTQRGANSEKRAALDATAEVLNQARADLTSTFSWRMHRSWQSG
jgi:hypothetical protein